jgi:putative peptide zinc metalloprotease protein
VAAGGPDRLILVLPDGTKVPVDRPLTIGRSDEASVRIEDQTVSRTHVKITFGPDGPLIEDAGSRFGTLVSGSLVTAPRRLQSGDQLKLGNVAIRVESATPVEPSGRSLPREAGETVVVPLDATLLGLRAGTTTTGDGALRPRLRSGWALKRLGAEEGDERFVLRDLRSGAFLRMAPDEAELLEMLDGKRTIPELLSDSERAIGPGGPGRLAALLADLADRGLISGVTAPVQETEAQGKLAKVLAPRERVWEGAADYFQRAYRHWGWFFFSPLPVTFLVLLTLAGFGVFAYLIGARYGTPFVVANRLLIGGAVFIAGRFVLVWAHELAHGLALAHYKRKVPRAGMRLLLIFPFAFVDTSESYFEPRRHRIVISAAGPACDFTLGAVFALACASAPAGSVRDVFFQLAFGAYVFGFFNLNPFLDRDGYTILVDFLREPGLKQRARQQFSGRVSGSARGQQTSSVLGRYALAGLIWSALMAVGMIIFATRYYSRYKRLIPHSLIIPLFIGFIVILLLPVLAQILLPMLRRLRYGPAEVNRVIR